MSLTNYVADAMMKYMNLLIYERHGNQMKNLILFVNSFLSYLLIVGIITVLAGIAIFIGIKMRRYKDANKEQETQTEESV